MFYRFNDGSFVEAITFEEAKKKKLAEIENEQEDKDNWHKCTCLGLSHRYDCPEMEIPF
tara:strand:- start:1180 stop:1356 length:177 start_codon:yes stop_codon:yes gene_type:complete